MGERMWLDDIRKPPWGYSLWAKTAEEAIEMLQRHAVEHCSLDHDLHETHYAHQDNHPGGYNAPSAAWDRSSFKELTGYAVLEWMRESGAWVPEILVHSLSTGADDMMTFLRQHAPEWVKFRRVKPKET